MNKTAYSTACDLIKKCENAKQLKTLNVTFDRVYVNGGLTAKELQHLDSKIFDKLIAF